LTGPAGQLLTAPAQFTIQATATDPDGQIAKIEFYDGSTKLAEAVSPPYQLEFSNVPARQFRFVARAIDDLGAAQDSNPVEVTIVQPEGSTAPAISTQPRSQTANVGETVTFFVAASGTPPLSFQWLFNNTPLAGEINATLLLRDVQLAHAGSYRVVVTTTGGSVTSDAAVLTVNSGTGGRGPALKLTRAVGGLLVSWPVSAEGFTLQSADLLSATTAWTDVATPPFVNGQEKSVPITATATRRFYRLRKP
jgi:hypothetical protein